MATVKTAKTQKTAQDKYALTPAQETVRDKFIPLCSAELGSRRAVLEAAKGSMPPEGIAAAVRAAYVAAGCDDKTASTRASEVKRIVAGIRSKTVKAADVKGLPSVQQAAAKCPAVSNRGKGQTTGRKPNAGGSAEKAKAEIAEQAAPKVDSPLAHIQAIELALNLLRASAPEDDAVMLSMIADLTDIAGDLAELVAAKATAKAA